MNDNYLPVWLQELGYNTYYTGKLWNAHSFDTYDKPYAAGFNGSDFLLDPYTYEYYNGAMTRNGAKPVSIRGQYSPDVVAEKAYGFLREATLHEQPFFLTAAPIAPHGDFPFEPWNPTAPKYAARHAHLFRDYKIPRTENFNPEKQGGVGWIRGLPRLNDSVIEYNDEYQRARLRSLQSVDEMVEGLIKILEEKGLMDNTYFIFTTDNGYHISQHRMHPGKECGYDTDIHIPLVIRGPGLAPGRTVDIVTTHTDLSPTIMEIAGGKYEDYAFDGLPIPLDTESELPKRTEHVNVEFWGTAMAEGKYGYKGNVHNIAGPGAYYNNTYKSVRLISDDYSLYYSVWCTNEKEFYDLKTDSAQIVNLFADENFDELESFQLASRSWKHVVDRLDALMMVLKSCQGHSCTDPWRVLHPQGDVASLTDALKEDFDSFYGEQPQVSFDKCEMGYIRESEGPQDANVFGHSDSENQPSRVLDGGSGLKYQGPWHYYV